jgi:hypothetical protein
MIKVGDEVAGFSVATEVGDQVLRVVGHGFWDVDVARSFGHQVLDAFAAHPRVTRFVFDFRLLKPLRDEGQDGFAQVLAALRTPAPPHVSVMTSSPLTKLQLLRIVKETGCDGWVEFN